MKAQRKRYRVLMVEDSRLSLEVYAQRLERRGYIVGAATSAEEARQRLEEGQPDIILLDVFMPKVSGFDFLTELRSTPRTSTTPVMPARARKPSGYRPSSRATALATRATSSSDASSADPPADSLE